MLKWTHLYLSNIINFFFISCFKMTIIWKWWAIFEQIYYRFSFWKKSWETLKIQFTQNKGTLVWMNSLSEGKKNSIIPFSLLASWPIFLERKKAGRIEAKNRLLYHDWLFNSLFYCWWLPSPNKILNPSEKKFGIG